MLLYFMTKYTPSIAKRERNLKMIDLVKRGHSFSDIAKKHNLSRERVRQIFKKFNITGDDLPTRSLRYYYLCNYCHSTFGIGLGKVRKVKGRPGQPFCGVGCYKKYRKEHGEKDFRSNPPKPNFISKEKIKVYNTQTQ